MHPISTKRALPLALLLAQCHHTDPSPAAQLPPATQSGANTFGCLVNGQLWVPQGFDGRSNYSIAYDAGINNGIFDLQTYRYPDNSSFFQSIHLDVISNCRVGIFSLHSPKNTRAVYQDGQTNCYWSSSDSATTFRRGTLTITRLDLTNGIIAGTFDFTLYKPGCDTVRVTQGRFDYNL